MAHSGSTHSNLGLSEVQSRRILNEMRLNHITPVGRFLGKMISELGLLLVTGPGKALDLKALKQAAQQVLSDPYLLQRVNQAQGQINPHTSNEPYIIEQSLRADVNAYGQLSDHDFQKCLPKEAFSKPKDCPIIALCITDLEVGRSPLEVNGSHEHDALTKKTHSTRVMLGFIQSHVMDYGALAEVFKRILTCYHTYAALAEESNRSSVPNFKPFASGYPQELFLGGATQLSPKYHPGSALTKFRSLISVLWKWMQSDVTVINFNLSDIQAQGLIDAGHAATSQLHPDTMPLRPTLNTWIFGLLATSMNISVLRTVVNMRGRLDQGRDGVPDFFSAGACMASAERGIEPAPLGATSDIRKERVIENALNLCKENRRHTVENYLAHLAQIQRLNVQGDAMNFLIKTVADNKMTATSHDMDFKQKFEEILVGDLEGISIFQHRGMDRPMFPGFSTLMRSGNWMVSQVRLKPSQLDELFLNMEACGLAHPRVLNAQGQPIQSSQQLSFRSRMLDQRQWSYTALWMLLMAGASLSVWGVSSTAVVLLLTAAVNGVAMDKPKLVGAACVVMTGIMMGLLGKTVCEPLVSL